MKKIMLVLLAASLAIGMSAFHPVPKKFLNYSYIKDLSWATIELPSPPCLYGVIQECRYVIGGDLYQMYYSPFVWDKVRKP